MDGCRHCQSFSANRGRFDSNILPRKEPV